MSKWYRISPQHYNDVPDDIMQGDLKVLEFGSATGINQLASRHRDFFVRNNAAGRYLGIDTRMYCEQYLNIEQGDIRIFDTGEKFNIVLALHVMEHIEIHHWRRVFAKLGRMLVDGGLLIVGVPCDECAEEASNEEHVVFNITRELLEQYLPGADIREIHNYRFHEDGARFRWALVRFVKRWLLGHPMVSMIPRLLAVWKKEMMR